MAWSTSGTVVFVSKHSSSTFLFSRSGSTTIRQVESVETKEIRGLTESAAKGMCGVTDSTTQTAYYAKIDGLVFSFTATTGTKTEKSGARRDESGQWCVTERKTTCSVTPSPLPSAWGTTPLNEDGEAIALSASGKTRMVSIENSSSNIWEWGGDAVNQTIRVVTKEIRYINSETSASSIAAANNSNTVSITTLFHDTTQTGTDGEEHVVVGAWCYAKTGTEKFASARRVSERDGWTVVVTEKTYAFNGNGWHT